MYINHYYDDCIYVLFKLTQRQMIIFYDNNKLISIRNLLETYRISGTNFDAEVLVCAIFGQLTVVIIYIWDNYLKLHIR